MLKENHLNLDKLPDFEKWRAINGESFSMFDYIFASSHVEIAIAYTKVFWPDFFEYKGGYFLKDIFDESIYQQWEEKLKGNISEIEKVINHLHIEDLFQDTESFSQQNILYLGSIIAEMWSARLSQLYPSVKFEVNCEQEDYVTVISFCQI